MSSTLSYYAPRTMLTLVALITAIVPFIADYNETHVFNPKWPGTYRIPFASTSKAKCFGKHTLTGIHRPRPLP